MNYQGCATAPDGNVIARITGSLPEVANWADNLIRSNGECQINIGLIPISVGGKLPASNEKE